MARIGIDATSVSPAGKGIARVQCGTVEALADDSRHELVVFVRPAAAEVLAGAQARVEVVDPLLTIVWEQVGMTRAIRAHRLDLMLTWTERLPVAGGGRFVVWLFELPGYRIEQNRRDGAGFYQRGSDLVTLALWRRGLRRAAHVLAGSRATADELLAALPELEGRVTVLYPGLEEAFTPGPGRPGRYVFHLASADPRDDTETAVSAFARAAATLGTGVRLLVAGNLGARRPLVEAEAARAGADVELLGRVSDPELVELYRGAVAYLDTSLYEGFGYQVLEAMACGAPVVATRVTSIPELVGDAALLCDPRDPDALAAALVRVLGDDAFARRLAERGRARAGEFTWDRTARTLSAVVAETAG